MFSFSIRDLAARKLDSARLARNRLDWRNSDRRAGIRFTKLSDSARWSLKEWLLVKSGEKADPPIRCAVTDISLGGCFLQTDSPFPIETCVELFLCVADCRFRTEGKVTVELQDSTERTYDPRRQQGVSLFREEMRSFSVGDRIQFTAPASELRIANRELGTIESIGEDGRLRLNMDGGRAVELDPRQHPHLDHGYAMTSHSSQGQTADRVLIHVDTELGAKDLLNSRMAYVSVSRGRYDAQIYTNHAATLGQELARDVSHSPAIQQEQAAHKIEPQTTHTNQIGQGFGLGL